MRAQCFIDGGHLRATSRRLKKPLVNPRTLGTTIGYSELVQFWQTARWSSDSSKFVGHQDVRIGLTRVVYYDARPDDGADPDLESYWRAIEELPDTEIGFGAVRGRPRRQKRVDGLIAVDMLVGAFTSLFDVAVLVAADADFVPIVDAVRQRGVMVVVAAFEASLSGELRRAADRVWPIQPEKGTAYFPPLESNDGRVWREDQDGTIHLVSR
jgi:uncharacterized LabA/DUF88 family protein